MAKHARHGPGPPMRSVLGTLRSVGLVVVGTVVLGAAMGLLLTEDGPSTGAHAEATALPRLDESIMNIRALVTAPSTTAPEVSRSPEPIDGKAAAEGDWSSVLSRLDTARTEAFGVANAGLLTAVYVDGSAPLERDTAAMIKLADAGVRAVGLRLVVEEIAVVRETSDEVVLRVSDRMPGYQLVAAGGSIMELRSGRGAATWLVTLRGGSDAWRIAAISAA